MKLKIHSNYDGRPFVGNSSLYFPVSDDERSAWLSAHIELTRLAKIAFKEYRKTGGKDESM